MKRRSGDWHDWLCMSLCGLALVAMIGTAISMSFVYGAQFQEERRQDAIKRGFLSAEMGLSELSCPYHEQFLHEAWLEGYMQSIAKKREQ
jgi:ribosome modulation factor